MSAMMAIVQEGRVHVLTDAVLYDCSTGKVTSFVNKIVPLPRTHAVFALRGKYGCYEAFFWAAALTPYDGFDGFVKMSDEVWARFEANLSPGLDCELMVAGWSDERERAEVLYRTTHDLHDGLPAGNWFLLGERSAFGIALENLPPVEEFDPDRDALAAFEEGRRWFGDLAEGKGQPCMGYGVGGWIAAALLQPNIPPSVKIIHRWPDVIGEPIIPEGV